MIMMWYGMVGIRFVSGTTLAAPDRLPLRGCFAIGVGMQQRFEQISWFASGGVLPITAAGEPCRWALDRKWVFELCQLSCFAIR